jgi:hypothetical protein
MDADRPPTTQQTVLTRVAQTDADDFVGLCHPVRTPTDYEGRSRAGLRASDYHAEEGATVS